MKTPKYCKHLTLVDTCIGIGINKHNEYMKDTVKANGSRIRKLIKHHCPELYFQLGLEFPNPYEYKAVKKEGLLVYCHSMIEYFFTYS